MPEVPSAQVNALHAQVIAHPARYRSLCAFLTQRHHIVTPGKGRGEAKRGQPLEREATDAPLDVMVTALVTPSVRGVWLLSVPEHSPHDERDPFSHCHVVDDHRCCLALLRTMVERNSPREHTQQRHLATKLYDSLGSGKS